MKPGKKKKRRQTQIFGCMFVHKEKENVDTYEIVYKNGLGSYVKCNGCGAQGPLAKDREAALERWNETINDGDR